MKVLKLYTVTFLQDDQRRVVTVAARALDGAYQSMINGVRVELDIFPAPEILSIEYKGTVYVDAGN